MVASFILYTPAYFPDYVGGGERLVQLTAAGFRELGVEVAIATDAPRQTSYELDGVEVLSVPHLARGPAGTPRAPVVEALAELLRARRAHVLHTTSLDGLGALAEAAKGPGARLGLAATEYAVACHRKTLVRGDGSPCPGPKSSEDCFACRNEDKRTRDRVLAGIGRVVPNTIAAALTTSASRLVGRPFGMHLHAWRRFADEESGRHRALSELDLLVLPTRYTRDIVAPHAGARARCEVLMHPLADALRGAEPKRTPADVLRVGFVGRALPIKGLDVLVEAVERARRRLPAELRVFCPRNVGERTERTRLLEQRVRAMQDSSWTWCGVLDPGALRELHREIDVLVVPSVWPEWLGFVSLEAQGLGTPLVLSDLASQRELADGDGRASWFVPPGDVEALARCLVDVWQRKQEGTLAAPRVVAPTPAEYAADLLRLYEALGRR